MTVASLDPQLKSRIEAAGQQAVLRFWDALDAGGRSRLARQLAAVDFELIGRLASDEDASIDGSELATRAMPPSAIRMGPQDNRHTEREALDAGEQALSDGRVGMILVAGGQGTRLGFDRPKGMFPLGPVSGRTLFQMIFDQLAARRIRHGAAIPLYVMTSPATHDASAHFLKSHSFFGLPESDVAIFCQGTMPAVDARSGEILLSAKDSLAVSPDGHGGMLAAFRTSGGLRNALDRGIEQLFYAQIDNPLVQVCDPALIGYHLLNGSQLTTQVVQKSDPLERVGNVVEIDGHMHIIEYSDLPDEVATRTDADGRPLLWAGNIAVHVFERSFLEVMADRPEALPFHRARKRVSHLSAEGEPIRPSLPNAIKFERFIFDLLPHAENALAVEAAKSRAFAPVKNADDQPTDTPRQAQQALLDLHRSWLGSVGVRTPRAVEVEIDPRFALDREELARRRSEIGKLDRSTYLTD